GPVCPPGRGGGTARIDAEWGFSNSRQTNPLAENSMDTALTAISEADIEKHRAMAQSFITRVVVLEDSSGSSQTELAGTGRRFVSTVSTGSVRRTREVELAKTVRAVRPDDQLMSI